jgi:hypothetical protein
MDMRLEPNEILDLITDGVLSDMILSMSTGDFWLSRSEQELAEMLELLWLQVMRGKDTKAITVGIA